MAGNYWLAQAKFGLAPHSGTFLLDAWYLNNRGLFQSEDLSVFEWVYP